MRTSVIITSYNAEKFIAEAINSVFSQTQLPDEILVVDDCSTDGTAEKIKAFGNRVTYLKTPQNSGALPATFFGLLHATGEIMFFLDGDDVWLPEKIKSVLPVFEQDPLMGIVSHDYFRVDGNRKVYNFKDETQHNIESILQQHATTEARSDAFKDSIFGKKGFWGGSAYALRRSFIDVEAFEKWKSGIDFIRYTYLDLVLPTFIMIRHPEVRVGYVHKKLFEYRIHASNSSGNKIPDITSARNALRAGYSTTKATYFLVKDEKGLEVYAQRQRLMLMEYEYLEDVYNNRKWKSLKKFMHLTGNLWNRKQFFKESKRISISLLLGPKAFLYLKNKWVQ